MWLEKTSSVEENHGKSVKLMQRNISGATAPQFLPPKGWSAQQVINWGLIIADTGVVRQTLRI